MADEKRASKVMLTIRLTPKERQYVRVRAAECGLSMEAYARTLLLTSAVTLAPFETMDNAVVRDRVETVERSKLVNPPPRTGLGVAKRKLTAADVAKLSYTDQRRYAKGEL